MPKPVTKVQLQEVKPDPELEKGTRRIFNAEYKLKIIQLADACQYGELGGLLRREKLYHGQLKQWRQELAEQGLSGLAKSVPGPKAKMSPEQKRIAQLEKEVMKLQKQLRLKDGCLELQKKALEMLDNLDNGSDALC